MMQRTLCDLKPTISKELAHGHLFLFVSVSHLLIEVSHWSAMFSLLYEPKLLGVLPFQVVFVLSESVVCEVTVL